VVNVIVIGGDKESMCHANVAIHTSLIETAGGGGCYSSWNGRLRDVILSLDGGHTIANF